MRVDEGHFAIDAYLQGKLEFIFHFPILIFRNLIRGASGCLVDRLLGREDRTIHEITRTNTNKEVDYEKWKMKRLSSPSAELPPRCLLPTAALRLTHELLIELLIKQL